MSGWIGVDLDGTLAHYDGWKGETHIGNPVQPMLERVMVWLAEGKEVRIMTARVCRVGEERDAVVKAIDLWCIAHIGRTLPITHEKDYGMIELWDDRCVAIEKNTGRILAMPLGATGQFPDGIDGVDDEGELRIAIAADPIANIVRIEFGKPTAWLAMSKQYALNWARGIAAKAAELK